MRGKAIRVLVDRSSLFLWLAIFVGTVAFNALGFYAFSGSPINALVLTIRISIHFASLAFFTFASFFCNRACNRVLFHDGLLERRGLLGGFRKTIEAKSILEVRKTTLPRDGTYFVLVDGVGVCEERIRRKSAIFVPFTEKGLNFIKAFYDGPIPPLD